MLNGFQLFSLITILAVTYGGGFHPLFMGRKTNQLAEYSGGLAFTAGVFLALSLTLMLPSSLHLLGKAFPNLDYPLASLIVICSYLILLRLEHVTNKTQKCVDNTEHAGLMPANIPIIMTIMIAIPSFFLGTALGVSETSAAVLIWIAIMAHKSSAAFALALKMVRSTLGKNNTYIIFSLFALSTPFGIIVGQNIHNYFADQTMVIIKGAVLGMASGTFLYMGTLHELENAPLIKHCISKKGFIIMLCGFILTAFVRFLIGEAHRLPQ